MSKESKKSKSQKEVPAQTSSEAPSPKVNPRSFCDVAGPWETKKISIFGAVRSVISQLRNGQDMTRVSLPACFLAPLSALELGASKFMGFLHILYDVKDEVDPLKRFLLVLRWYLACYCEIKFNHKPYNPVINESHQCTVENGGSKATYIAEQVSHHPPLSAIHISNPEKDLTVVGNITFAIKFGGNSASCESKGDVRVTIGDETYFISKGMPDVLLTNVVIGARFNTWNGEVNISCAKTGYRAHLKLTPKDSKSHVEGSIFRDERDDDAEEASSDSSSPSSPSPSSSAPASTASASTVSASETLKKEPVLVFSGHWAEEAIYAEPSKPKKEKSSSWFFGGKKEKEKDDKKQGTTPGPRHLVIDSTSKMEKAQLIFPAEHEMEDTDSLLVWRDVSLAITGDDLPSADIHKTKVEVAQRLRMKSGAEQGTERRFFSYNAESQMWLWNGRLYNGTDFLAIDEDQSQTLGTSTLDSTTGGVSDDEFASST